MNQKTDITKYVIAQRGLSMDDKQLRALLATWWFSTRKKENGGLRLTDQGFDCLSKYIKFHRVSFQEEFHYNNQLVIWLDRFINCPWYLANNEIYVFDEKMAVQLVLFNGNIEKFAVAKAKSLKST
jgi:hypothetical protein